MFLTLHHLDGEKFYINSLNIALYGTEIGSGELRDKTIILKMHRGNRGAVFCRESLDEVTAMLEKIGIKTIQLTHEEMKIPIHIVINQIIMIPGGNSGICVHDNDETIAVLESQEQIMELINKQIDKRLYN